MRAELNIPWSVTLTPTVIGYDPGQVELLENQAPTFSRLAKVGPPQTADAAPPGSAQIVVKGTTIAFPLAEHIDIDAEKARLSKAASAAEKERDSLAQRLSNPNFTERAKPEAVDKARFDHEAKAAEAERLRAALERLG
jgi:valyl-tRNA synthetase